MKSEFEQLNSKSQVEFIQSDISLLRNVDKVCDEIKSKEEHINLLFLSQGVLTTKHDENSEGLDKKFALHYYSRLYFTENLLPLLTRAGTAHSKFPARVVSVLGAGSETSMNMDDLALKSTYSMRACANHAITMNTLAFRELVSKNKWVTFIHSQPGGVSGTNAARDMPKWMNGLLVGASSTILRPWVMTAKEAGERLAWTGTVANFGSGGEAVLVGPKGEKTGDAQKLAKMQEDGIQDKVWKHTMEVFDKICGRNEKY